VDSWSCRNWAISSALTKICCLPHDPTRQRRWALPAPPPLPPPPEPSPSPPKHRSSLPCSKLDIPVVSVPSAGGGGQPEALSQARASCSPAAWLAVAGPSGRRPRGSGVAEGELVGPGAPPLDAPSRSMLCSLPTPRRGAT
jgi:hypothetical protein